MEQPSAERALKKLEPLVGEWRMTATPPGGPPWPGEGRTIFEWHESGAHLIERSTVDMPEAPDGVSIIGCDGANGTYSSNARDRPPIASYLGAATGRTR